MITPDTGDDQLLAAFEAATLSGECFHHAEHVRIAYLYLCRYPVLEALEKFSSGLKKFAASLGKARLYHETITWAYIFLIRERMAGEKQSWTEFAHQNPDLLIWKSGPLDRYYSPERLASEAARRGFVLPDRLSR